MTATTPSTILAPEFNRGYLCSCLKHQFVSQQSAGTNVFINPPRHAINKARIKLVRVANMLSAHKVSPMPNKTRLANRQHPLRNIARLEVQPQSTKLTTFLPVIRQSALEIMVNIFCMLLNDDPPLKGLEQRELEAAGG